MTKLTLKQKLAGVVNVYEVKLTVYVHHQSADEARSYVTTALQEWAVDGKCIPSLHYDSIEESNRRFLIKGVTYPEDFEAIEELK
jgi:hypothetical protein